MSGRVRSAFAAWCLIAAAAAAVPSVDDVRLLWSPQLGNGVIISGRVDDETHATLPTVNFSQHEVVALGADLRTHRRYGVGVYRSLEPLRPGIGSLLYGLEVAEDRTAQEQSSRGTHETTEGDIWLADAFVGWAYALTPWWHLEQGLLAGAGEGTWRWRAEGYLVEGDRIDSSSTDSAYEFGFRIGSYWTIGDWQLGIDIRHLVMRSSARFRARVLDEETFSYRPSIEIRGLGGVASLGWRF